jgi:hypothetical protein
MSVKNPEDEQKKRAERETSNFDVISAFAKSESLQLFKVGNKSNEILPVLASSKKNASIIAKFYCHIHSLENASFYQVLEKADFGTGLRKAIMAGVPGVIWIRKGYVITRDNVFYDRDFTPLSPS